jgi:hypothetical protein
MKNPGHLHGVGRGIDQDKRVLQPHPRTRSSARTASPKTFSLDNRSTANEAERHFHDFVDHQRRAHQTLDRADADRAAKAFGKFLYASIALENGGLK